MCGMFERAEAPTTNLGQSYAPRSTLIVVAFSPMALLQAPMTV
jgi:hypothetical protein